TDYDALREQWRFYSSVAEQRLNILPAYDPQQRWFVMLHSRGKVWLELQDPGVPGLMEYWINLMRKGTYDRQLYSDHVPGSHFNAGGVHDDGTGQVAETFALPANYRPSPVDPHSMALEVTRGRDPSSWTVGSRFFLTLDSPRIPGGALQIGRVVPQRGTEVLAALNENFKVRGQAPRTMLALPFPYDLLPTDVKAAVDATPEAVDPGSAEADPGKPMDPEEAAQSKQLPVVVFKTNYGTIGIELFEDDCPNTTANFIQLLEQRFYDGTTFHFEWSDQTNKGFVQGGSPDGSLDGDAGFYIRDEASPHKHLTGSVSMAKAGGKANTASSQFFICREDQPFFDGKFTVFGRVVQGLDVIAAMPKGTKVIRSGVDKKRDHVYPVERIDLSEERKKKPRR
ncbi:MAG: peptidylprolyl isomerase, partial [Planctomycetota bacterium]